MKQEKEGSEYSEQPDPTADMDEDDMQILDDFLTSFM